MENKIQIKRCKFWRIFLTQEMWDNNPLKFLFHDECLTLMKGKWNFFLHIKTTYVNVENVSVV
jgi:hypothetical protein